MATGIIDAVPLVQVFKAGLSVPNVKLFFGSTTTLGGVATIYATSDGTTTGTPLFSSVLHADGTAWSSGSSAISSAIVAGKSIASDNKTISFNCVVGGGVLLGGSTLSFVADGTKVTCVAWGLP